MYSRVKLIYQPHAYQVVVEFTRADVDQSRKPPVNLVERAERRLLAAQTKGDISTYAFYPRELKRAWRGLRDKDLPPDYCKRVVLGQGFQKAGYFATMYLAMTLFRAGQCFLMALGLAQLTLNWTSSVPLDPDMMLAGGLLSYFAMALGLSLVWLRYFQDRPFLNYIVIQGSLALLGMFAAALMFTKIFAYHAWGLILALEVARQMAVLGIHREVARRHEWQSIAQRSSRCMRRLGWWLSCYCGILVTHAAGWGVTVTFGHLTWMLLFFGIVGLSMAFMDSWTVVEQLRYQLMRLKANSELGKLKPRLVEKPKPKKKAQHPEKKAQPDRDGWFSKDRAA